MKFNPQESHRRLLHILNAVRAIQKYSIATDKASFCINSLIQDAILYQFTVIGEAIKHVDTDILNKYPYPWYKVRAFRNLVAHEYFNVKLSAVWQIIENDLPELETQIQSIIYNEFQNGKEG
jgi:uncharacterized protein with HEPN domain